MERGRKHRTFGTKSRHISIFRAAASQKSKCLVSFKVVSAQEPSQFPLYGFSFSVRTAKVSMYKTAPQTVKSWTTGTPVSIPGPSTAADLSLSLGRWYKGHSLPILVSEEGRPLRKLMAV